MNASQSQGKNLIESAESLAAEWETIRKTLAPTQEANKAHWRKILGTLAGGASLLALFVLMGAATKNGVFGGLGVIVFVVTVFALQRISRLDPNAGADTEVFRLRKRLLEIDERLFDLNALPEPRRAAIAKRRTFVRRKNTFRLWFYGILFIPCVGLGLMLLFFLLSGVAGKEDDTGKTLVLVLTLAFLGGATFLGLTMRSLWRQRRNAVARSN